MSNTTVPAVDAAIAEETIPVSAIFELLSENIRLLLVAPLAAGVFTLGFSFLIAPTFTATTKFLPPQQNQSSASLLAQNLGSLAPLAGGALKNPADQYVGLLQSRSVQDRLIERFKLMERYNTKYKESAAKVLANNTKIATGKDGLIKLDLEDVDPEISAHIANAYVEELGALLGRLAITEAQHRRVFFEKQLLISKDKLIEAEKSLRSIGVDSGALKSNPQTAVAGVAQLEARISAQEVKVASMRGMYSESAPDVKLALTELGALKNQLTKLSNTTPSAAEGGYVDKYRNFKYHETLYDLMARQYELAKVDESKEGAAIQIVDAAQTPEMKSGPKRGLLAVMATIFTGFLMLLWITVRHLWAGWSKDPVFAEKTTAILQNLRNGLRWRTKK
jgi:uncharacterized protein involved in exopolysaccharide biosynthesis